MVPFASAPAASPSAIVQCFVLGAFAMLLVCSRKRTDASQHFWQAQPLVSFHIVAVAVYSLIRNIGLLAAGYRLLDNIVWPLCTKHSVSHADRSRGARIVFCLV